MRELSERDKDNLAAIMDYCDRISSIVERFGNSFEKYNTDADYRDAILTGYKQEIPHLLQVAG